MSDVVGIGVQLADVYASIPAELLEQVQLKKSYSHVVNDDEFNHIHSLVKPHVDHVSCGGKVPNTLSGLRLFGVSAAAIGAIGTDEYAQKIKSQYAEEGVDAVLTETSVHTGTALFLITPDQAHTYAVSLGAAPHVTLDESSIELVSNAKVLHFSGYEFDNPLLRQVVRQAVEVAKKNNVLVSLDLSDVGVVQRNIIDLKSFVKDFVDVLFVNEEEAEEFTGKPADEAIEYLSEFVTLACLKKGTNGSTIKSFGNTYHIDSYPAKVIDTSGAGDMYAAAILFSVVKEIDFDRTKILLPELLEGIDFTLPGKLASYASAKVIEAQGPRLKELDISKF